ncbi:hypothetical protein EG68_03973 [Paragonimus skrjabini miyazakii]|uniref:Uncharacterized protein n=1 Tax=Paragonimus skrjabini miyazakii TaxID=59628 RepID=A0A8S9YW65_9TREM|nr:hypothetical protein EG68_03973 [Paragonimus skrjabini miyazakii]
MLQIFGIFLLLQTTVDSRVIIEIYLKSFIIGNNLVPSTNWSKENYQISLRISNKNNASERLLNLFAIEHRTSVSLSTSYPFSFSYVPSQNTSHDFQVTVTSIHAHRWTFGSYIQVEQPITLSRQNAGWRQFSVINGGASLHLGSHFLIIVFGLFTTMLAGRFCLIQTCQTVKPLVTQPSVRKSLNFFVRWYCEHEFYGMNCDRHCNEFECDTGILYNQTDYLTHQLTHSQHYIPELFDPICLKAPCVVFNIPRKAMVCEDALRIAVDSYLNLRFFDAPYMDTQPHLKIANLPNSTFEVSEVKLADGRQMVTVSVGATLAGVPITPMSVRRILVEVSNAGLLSLCIMKAQHETSPYSKSPVHRTTGDPCHHWLIVGFWIVLAMAFVLSCIIGVLIQKRKTAKHIELCQCQHLIADDQRSIHSIYRTDRQ